jgi:hypothetical protein
MFMYAFVCLFVSTLIPNKQHISIDFAKTKRKLELYSLLYMSLSL